MTGKQIKPLPAGAWAAMVFMAAGMGAIFYGCLIPSGKAAGAAQAAPRYNDAQVAFSRPDGFYDKSFSLALSFTIPGAVV